MIRAVFVCLGLLAGLAFAQEGHPLSGSWHGDWSAPDGKSVFAAVGVATNEYEVDRVTALCN